MDSRPPEMLDAETVGVSFVIPVHNGEAWLEQTLAAIAAQADGRPWEVVAVEDGSRDGSRAILQRHQAAGDLVLVDGERRGAAAAANLGIRRARHPVVCQVDQDVLLQPGWMAELVRSLAEPNVAAAQGYYATDRAAPLLSRVMGYDLELRYARIRGTTMDHVCTGNTAYRVACLDEVGGFDETLGYGYDNDMSYRLGAAGYRLAFCRDARSIHRWREGWVAYLRQQYGVGYGRLDLVNKHRGPRVKGDDVSGLRMILHVPLLALAVAALLLAWPATWLGVPAALLLGVAAGCVGAVLLDRTVAGFQALALFRDPACLAFAPVHLLRDLAWLWALIVWTWRRLTRRPTRPRHSMFRP